MAAQHLSSILQEATWPAWLLRMGRACLHRKCLGGGTNVGHVGQVGLFRVSCSQEHLILLPLAPEWWDSRLVPLNRAYVVVLGIKPRASYIPGRNCLQPLSWVWAEFGTTVGLNKVVQDRVFHVGAHVLEVEPGVSQCWTNALPPTTLVALLYFLTSHWLVHRKNMAREWTVDGFLHTANTVCNWFFHMRKATSVTPEVCHVSQVFPPEGHTCAGPCLDCFPCCRIHIVDSIGLFSLPF